MYKFQRRFLYYFPFLTYQGIHRGNIIN
jgi:hypothetical protein